MGPLFSIWIGCQSPPWIIHQDGQGDSPPFVRNCQERSRKDQIKEDASPRPPWSKE